MTPSNRHYEDWELYALGSLPEANMREMSVHLESCDECGQEYALALAVMSAIGSSLPQVEPSEAAERKLRARLTAGTSLHVYKNTAARKPIVWYWWRLSLGAATFASLAVAIWLGIDGRQLEEKLQSQTAQTETLQRQLKELAGRTGGASNPSLPGEQDLRKSVADLQGQLEETKQARVAAEKRVTALDVELREAKDAADRKVEELKTELQAATKREAILKNAVQTLEHQRSQNEEMVAQLRLELTKAQAASARYVEASSLETDVSHLLASGEFHQLDLKPVADVARQATARVLWQDDKGLLLLANNLPAVTDSREMQLWILQKGNANAARAGTLLATGHGSSVLFVQPGPALDAMAGVMITMEAAGANPAQPGSQILVGKP